MVTVKNGALSAESHAAELSRLKRPFKEVEGDEDNPFNAQRRRIESPELHSMGTPNSSSPMDLDVMQGGHGTMLSAASPMPTSPTPNSSSLQVSSMDLDNMQGGHGAMLSAGSPMPTSPTPNSIENEFPQQPPSTHGANPNLKSQNDSFPGSDLSEQSSDREWHEGSLIPPISPRPTPNPTDQNKSSTESPGMLEQSDDRNESSLTPTVSNADIHPESGMQTQPIFIL
jgi:hypothetical protein